jgi:thiamine-phosphate diphosphorylase
MAKAVDLSGVCVITAAGLIPGLTHLDVARAAVAAGARMVQLREKNASTRELYRLALEIREVTSGTPTLFIVNDRVDVALAVDANGVHVGPDDLPWAEARRLIGPDRILGVSAATPEEVKAAEAAGADYLGVGPAYATGSKADAGDAIGPEGVGRIASLTALPVIAIGGITSANASPVWESGTAGVAVISAVAGARDMASAVAELNATRPRS